MQIDEEFRLFQEDLLKTFLGEAAEHLSDVDEQLNLWQESGDEKLIQDVFRHIHTIKGSSGACNLMSLSENLHHFEDLLKLVADGEIASSDELLDCLFSCVDKLSDALKEVRETGDSQVDQAIPKLVNDFMKAHQNTPSHSDQQAELQENEEHASDNASLESPLGDSIDSKDQGSKVLFCDDDNHFAEMIERILRKEGFEVLRARNGQEGLDLISSEKVDLVLADYMMPELNGIELLEAMRAKKISTPYILLSGHVKIDDLAKSMLQFDACYFLEKPVNVNVLRLAVRQASRLYNTQQILEEMSVYNFRAYLGCKKLAYQNLEKEARRGLEQEIGSAMSTVVKLVDKLRKRLSFTPPTGERKAG